MNTLERHHARLISFADVFIGRCLWIARIFGNVIPEKSGLTDSYRLGLQIPAKGTWWRRDKSSDVHDTASAEQLATRRKIEDMPALPNPLLHIVLHTPEIPQNTGNIGRSCIAIGAKLWLVRPLGFQLEDKHLRRAGMDYWKHVDWEVVDNWEQLQNRLAESDSPESPRRYWFSTKFASKLVWDVSFQKGDVIVFGSESKGLPEQIRVENAENCIKLPMTGAVRSLNLASTANTLMYEAVRQFGGTLEDFE